MATEGKTIIRRLPVGVTNFKVLRSNHRYYVDKTMYLQKMEETSDFLFLIRPRRFGKSLFLSMVGDYYDCENKDIDDEFDGTWVGEHPLDNKGQFQVLQYDFSQVFANIDNLEGDFDSYCNIQLNGFIRKYGKYYSEDTIRQVRDAKLPGQKINIIAYEAKQRGYHLYLIIDEYDNFTNIGLNERGDDVYQQMTHSDGFYRNVFKIFKPNFEKILFMGVSPITLDDLTSGFNIATNISLHPHFDMLLGFSETDVREMIRYYQKVGLVKGDEDAIVADMKPWYDNYCFAEECYDVNPRMFNSNMVLYYMNSMITTGHAPSPMIDPNTKTDYAKMKRLVNLDRLDGNRKGIVQCIAEKGYIDADIVPSFPAYEMVKPDMFVSLLYYYGMLTIGGRSLDTPHLVIPNNNIREQYYRFLLEQYQDTCKLDLSELGDAFRAAALEGKWEPLCQYLADHYYEDSSIRDAIQGEHNIQGYFKAYLNLSRLFVAHPEVEMNHGYCDFFLLSNTKKYEPLKHSFIIEVKYLKADATDGEAQLQWDAAKKQVKSYADDKTVKAFTTDVQLHCIVLQFKAGKLLKMGEV